jgi:putative oxidoreductase
MAREIAARFLGTRDAERRRDAMKSSFSKDVALLILRLAGLAFAFAHGWGKIDELVWGDPTGRLAGIARLGFPAPLLFAWCLALTEFAGGLLIAAGLATRFAAAFGSFAMFVAAFARHRLHMHVLVTLGLVEVSEETARSWGDPERAFLFLLIFLALLLMGGGAHSLDHLLAKRRGSKR